MKRSIVLLVALLSLGVSACGSAIAPAQADGHDCNAGLATGACGVTSYCDPGVASSNGVYPRNRTYGMFGDKQHAVGTCRPKGAAGAACSGVDQCLSGRCVHREAPTAPGVCE
jgi:hypothetical protein